MSRCFHKQENLKQDTIIAKLGGVIQKLNVYELLTEGGECLEFAASEGGGDGIISNI